METLKPLPYPTDALEPYIDQKTVEIHHDKHLGNYVNKLNQAIEPYPQYRDWPLERLLRENDQLPLRIQKAVHDNGGGVLNHNLYFDNMGGDGVLSGKLRDQAIQAFGSEQSFFQTMKNAALSVFGSGYAYLVRDPEGRLKIIILKNQDTPLPLGLTPILPLDVWEHAYYLKHQNQRDKYIDDWFHVLNWEKIGER